VARGSKPGGRRGGPPHLAKGPTEKQSTSFNAEAGRPACFPSYGAWAPRRRPCAGFELQRAATGFRLYDGAMTVRCIDVETTGTDPATDAIVEIASVDLQRDSTIANQRETLVRPDIAVPAEASAVHLINADLVAAPRLEDVIDTFKGS
jgi:hypothetical protein